MKHSGMTRILVLLAAALLASVANAQTMSFDIPAGDAATRLSAWSARTGVKIDAPEALTRNRQTRAVKGTMDTRNALDEMIEGSGLQILADDGRLIFLGSNAIALDAPTPLERAYRDRLDALFAPAQAPQVVARIFVLPGNRPEHAVGLRLDQDQYSIFAIDPPTRVALMTANTGVRICSAEIAPPLARDLMTVWDAAIDSSTRRGEESPDSARYEMWRRREDGEFVKLVSNPALASPDAALAEIAERLEDYCAEPSEERRAGLASEAAALKAKAIRP